MNRLIGIGILICIVLAGGCEEAAKTPDPRLGYYLMPTVNSQAHKDWIEKNGDSADSWELFTVHFHTQFLKQLDGQIKQLVRFAAVIDAAHPELNDPNSPIDPNAPTDPNDE